MTAALLGAAAPCCCSRLRPVQNLSSPTSVLSSKNQGFHSHGSSSQLGLRVSSPWRGLKHVCHSFPSNYKQLGKKGKSRCKVVYASLFGVGAPEVLVIGVVALLVFGPKGLAERTAWSNGYVCLHWDLEFTSLDYKSRFSANIEVARNLGKTLRAFQPTIRELQEVSREFKSTLEREIGLDEVTSSSNNTYRPNSIFNENQLATSDPNGKPTAEPPLAATTNMTKMESPEEQPQAQITSEAVKSLSPSPEASTTASLEINAQIPSSENAEEGSK